ncbi:MAG: TRAP transporter fused permease subunit, partial [candidate division WOR-3 bacterium]
MKKVEESLEQTGKGITDDPELKCQPPAGVIGTIASVIAIGLGAFHLYTGGYRPLPGYEQRTIHLTIILVLVFLLRPYRRGRGLSWIDIALSVASAVTGVYLFLESDQILERIGVPTLPDTILGGALVLLVLEATRRVLGWAMPLIASVFLLYGFFGHLVPGGITHKGYDVERIVSQMSLALEGILGIPIGVSATYVILFVIFATFLSECGAGQFFLDISMALFGRFRGGPAKVSVLSSSLFGTISGSAAANVMVDGWLTIPLMKRIGFKPYMAGAIEAVNSTGGQIMPPVMGAAAFIMAEIVGTPYIKICIAAAIPALLYYLACYFMIDFEALKSGIKGLPLDELPNAKRVLSHGFYYLLPVFVLIFFMSVIMYTPMKSAIYAMAAAIVVSLAKPSTRMGLRKIFKTIERGVLGSIEVAMACACAGIIIGIFNLTGFGVRLSTLLIEASQGILPL